MLVGIGPSLSKCAKIKRLTEVDRRAEKCAVQADLAHVFERGKSRLVLPIQSNFHLSSRAARWKRFGSGADYARGWASCRQWPAGPPADVRRTRTGGDGG